MKALSVIAIFTAFLMALLLITPTFATPLAQNWTFKFYNTKNSDTLFADLAAGKITLMGWPLTATELATAGLTPGMATAPYGEAGTYGVAINCNLTDDAHMPGVNGHPARFVKAEADVHFRDAIACLVNKDDAIATVMGGMASRIDTEIPRPLDNSYVNYQVSEYNAAGLLLGNDPTNYNIINAITILWDYGFLSHSTYLSAAAAIDAYISGGNHLPAGSVIYPATLTTGETITGYTVDSAGFTAPIGAPVTTPEAASVVGTSVDAMVCYIRSDPNRKYIGDALVHLLMSLGISISEPIYPCTGSQANTPVMKDRSYDIYTYGWSLGGTPTWFYSSFGSWDIYPYGSACPNFYQFNDPLMDYWAMYDYPLAANASIFNDAVQQCQYMQVNQTADVPVYTLTAYMAYNAKALGVVDFQGWGLTQYLDYDSLFMEVPNPSGQYAPPMNIVYGTEDVPDQVNPVFQTWVWDQEVSDRMFSSGLVQNPYNPTALDKTIGVEPWQVSDYSFTLSDFSMGGGYETLPHPILGSGINHDQYTQCQNVTYWLRDDISWSDGVPLTAYDVNYTDFINSAYGNSWDYADMSNIVNFVIWNSTCFSVYLDMPCFLSFGLGVECDFLPMHLYSNIVCPTSDVQGDNANTDPWIATPWTLSGDCQTGLNGMWPGAAANPDQFINPTNIYSVTYTNVHDSVTGPSTMWVGSGIWEYMPGTLSATGMELRPNPYFFLDPSNPLGDINFQYTWDSTIAPSGGSYSINLPDLTYMANAYGTRGTVIPPATSNYVPPTPPGARGFWNPACDIAPPAGIVGLSDLATMAVNYGKHWGGYDQWTFAATGAVPSSGTVLTVTAINSLYRWSYTASQLPVTQWIAENMTNLPYSVVWAGTPTVTVSTATRTITAAY